MEGGRVCRGFQLVVGHCEGGEWSEGGGAGVPAGSWA